MIGTPTEAALDGTDMKVKVIYDKDDLVENAEYLHEQEEKKEEDEPGS